MSKWFAKCVMCDGSHMWIEVNAPFAAMLAIHGAAVRLV